MGYSTSGEFTNAERTKLTNIEALADVTDNSNVAAANAVMDADFSGARGFMKKTSAGVYDLITSQELNADIIDFIKQMHPNISVIAAMDDATLSDIKVFSDIYKLWGQYWINTSTYNSGAQDVWILATSKTITFDQTEVMMSCEVGCNGCNGQTTSSAYSINDGTKHAIKTETFYISDPNYYKGTVSCVDLSTNDVVRFYVKLTDSASGNGRIKNCEIESLEALLTGNALTDAIAANAAVLSFFSHLKGKYSNGGSTHTTPVGVEIFGNGDAYAASLNATTKFKIDVADPRIELYRTDDSEVAKSNDQTDWVLDDNVTNGAFPTKTTSTHETILAEEIGCASVVLVEKSVNGAFTDTEILIEDDDYTVDYSTRTATKIVLTSAEAADIVISQSKLRITWIADVEDIEGTANTALKMKIYLNRTAVTEASPEIQKIDLGTDKYAEVQYMCG